MSTRKRRKNVAPRELNRLQDAAAGAGAGAGAGADGDGDGDARVRVLLTDLPKEILIEIFSRLSVKSIFTCWSLCKLILDILISQDFANVHFSRAPTCPLLRNPNGKSISTALYLVELDQDRLDCRVCDAVTRVPRTKVCTSNADADTSCSLRGVRNHVNVKLSSRFMLPSIESRIEGSLKYRRLNVVNSCNGLVCLSGSMCRNPFGEYTKMKYDMVVIYNPVTGEYTIIPTPVEDKFTVISHVGGLGFCRKTDQYKVLIVVYKKTPRDPITRTSRTDTIAMIYTLGSGLWRTVSKAPDKFRKVVPVFLNGSLHWYFGDCGGHSLIICFNLEDEKFGIIPSQDPFCSVGSDKDVEDVDSIEKLLKGCKIKNYDRSMSVMRGRLCICETSNRYMATLWVMEEYGVKGSWVKVEIVNLPGTRDSYQPITYVNNGDLLLYQENNALISHDGNMFRYFEICGFKSSFEVVPHVPSFCSLKQMLGESIEVLNVRSRLGWLANNERQGGEIKPLFLVEEEWELITKSEVPRKT